MQGILGSQVHEMACVSSFSLLGERQESEVALQVKRNFVGVQRFVEVSEVKSSVAVAPKVPLPSSYQAPVRWWSSTSTRPGSGRGR